MYISPTQFPTAFEQIRRTSLSHSTCKLVVFVSCLDIDALCSAKIISNVLKMELIPHKIVPVVGYDELKKMYKELDESVVNVLCIGCGATIDLEEYFEIEEEQEVGENKQKIYIIDNHRPWNLENLFASKNIVCFDDGKVEENLGEHKVAYEFLSQDDEDEEDGEDDDEEEGEGEDDGEIEDEMEKDENQRNGINNLDGDTDNDNDDETQADNDNDSLGETGNDISQSDKSIAQAKKQVREARKRYTHLLEEYYNQGSFFNSSSTIQVYTLLSLIGQTSINNLWLAIVGLTSLDSQYPQIYNSFYPLLKDEAKRLSPQVDNNNNNNLFIESDYSLFLLRHWSLYESMIHSSYLSSKLHLWTEDGRKKLHKLLAKMGIALHESKELWTHMNIPLKRSLKSKLTSVSGMYGIDDIIRQGIIRKYGFKGSVSAGDCVESLLALLEAGSGDTIIHKTQAYNNEVDDDEEEMNERIEKSKSDKEKFWITNFWSGWDALDNFDLLLLGVSKAKILQQAIVNVSTSIFEKRQIKDLRSFRLAVLKEGPDLELFSNPLALARLGAWIAESCAEVHPLPLPLVVASYNPSRSIYLVLGMGPRKSREDNESSSSSSVIYNKFGATFQTVANEISARIRVDAFESSIIEVSKEDLSRFLEALTISGLR